MEPGMNTACPTHPVGLRELVVPGRERPRRALAVHQHVAPAVARGLGDVVRDVIDLPGAVRRRVAQDPPHRAAHAVGERVGVGPCRRPPARCARGAHNARMREARP